MRRVYRFARPPWKVTRNGPGCRDIGGAKPYRHRQAQYRTICSTTGWGLRDGADDVDRANARLIAAAPELLARLTGLANYVGCAEEPACNQRDRLCTGCETLRYLRTLSLVPEN